MGLGFPEMVFLLLLRWVLEGEVEGDHFRWVCWKQQELLIEQGDSLLIPQRQFPVLQRAKEWVYAGDYAFAGLLGRQIFLVQSMLIVMGL